MSRLLSLSREQRETIDRLLSQLDVVTRRAHGRLAKAAGAGTGARGGRAKGERT